MDEKKVIEEPVVETKTEYDAVHPRFAREHPEEVVKYEQEHLYYCKECKLHFAPTSEGLRIHFDRQIIKHTPYGSCFYCRGKVYAYTLEDRIRVYHNCRNNSSPDGKC